MDRISRRRFLEDSLALLTAASIPVATANATALNYRRRTNPNDVIHIAVIGLNGRGMNHLDAYLAMKDVAVTAICDPDLTVMRRAVKAVEKVGKPVPESVQDIRKLLEDKNLDAVSIATPNHWHALAAIWAMQAGKDVYVEKPVSHNISEGRRIVEVARKTNRICEAGTQSRASKGLIDAMAYLHEGNLGKISVSRGLCYKPRGSIGKTTLPLVVPPTIDYDLWLGPAPNKPPMRAKFHYDWHWFWDYGNGDLGNQGIHEMDKARWGLNKKSLPKIVVTVGGRFGYVDDGQTPNTLVSVFDYGDSQLIFEVRGLKTDALMDAKIGNIFYGEKGVMVVPNYSSAILYDNDGNKVREFTGGGDHFRNFINVMRSRKRSELFADIEEGHISSALCHLGNISYRLGTPQPFNVKTKAFGDDKEAYETFGRFEDHLAANGIILANEKYALGAQLKVDVKKERFTGNDAANEMLTREYRAPFVVPDKA